MSADEEGTRVPYNTRWKRKRGEKRVGGPILTLDPDASNVWSEGQEFVGCDAISTKKNLDRQFHVRGIRGGSKAIQRHKL